MRLEDSFSHDGSTKKGCRNQSGGRGGERKTDMKEGNQKEKSKRMVTDGERP